MSSRSRQRAASKVVPALPLERLDPWRWRIPRDEERGMRVDGIVFADDRLMEGLHDETPAAACGPWRRDSADARRGRSGRSSPVDLGLGRVLVAAAGSLPDLGSDLLKQI